jgi:hypothetical protein
MQLVRAAIVKMTAASHGQHSKHKGDSMNGIFFDSPASDDKRLEGLYSGDLYIYSPTTSTQALCQFARESAEVAFAPYHPTEAQDHMTVEEYAAILAEFKPKFIHDPQSKVHIQGIMEDFGCDMTETYFDVPRLRTMTHSEYLNAGLGLAFHPHRDTWYGSPPCQLVWWMPVYEIDGDNGMAFHPHYWDTPIKNSSCDYDYQNWEKNERGLAPQMVTQETRAFSAPTEPMELDPQFRIVTQPGGVTVFAAHHMHSTVKNITSRTRLSIDFRTVNRDDVIANRGAPNIDDTSQGSPLGDYMRASDLERVSPDIIAAHLESKER